VPVSDVQVLQDNSVNDYTDVAICHIPGSNTVGIGQVTSDDAKRHRSRFYRTIAPTIVPLRVLAGAGIVTDVFIIKETNLIFFFSHSSKLIFIGGGLATNDDALRAYLVSSRAAVAFVKKKGNTSRTPTWHIFLPYLLPVGITPVKLSTGSAIISHFSRRTLLVFP